MSRITDVLIYRLKKKWIRIGCDPKIYTGCGANRFDKSTNRTD
jgi:hypothetical protein